MLEKNDVAWLRHYYGPGCGVEDPFTYEFTGQQLEMITAIREAIEHGGDQAIAASRGEGKSTLAERLVLKSVLTGEVSYAVIFGASGAMADNAIDTLRQNLCDNERLIEDYPEVCVPVIALEGAPQRARSQKANGFRHGTRKRYEMAPLNYSWCGQELIFPDVPGSPSARAIIAARGLDAAVRGLKKRGKRPQIAIIDDPDTEDTARSEEQAAKLEARIDAAIGGLGGQRKALGRVMLTTIQSRISVSHKYTDPAAKPSFKGRRYKFLIAPPQRIDLWEEYVSLYQDDLRRRDDVGKNIDPFCRRSHHFYLNRREEMDAGAVVSNPNRFDGELLPDGSRREISALQKYFNMVATVGQEVVSTEYDNDPPEQTAVVETGLSPWRIQRQVSGMDRAIVPDGCTVITQGIDVRKVALHWVVRAWQPGATGYTLDYGVHETIGAKYGTDEGVDAAVTRAILARMEALRETQYVTESGEQMAVQLTLVDAGWKTDAVYSACLTVGRGIMPVMGFGRSSGCTQANFKDIYNRTPDRKPGDGWFLSRKGKLWLVCADTDRWKAWEHDRWMTSPDKPGCLLMYGHPAPNPEKLSDDQKAHHAYARHICNETEVDDMSRGVLRRMWKAKSDNTHWLDASYYSDVAANICGIRISTAASAVNAGPQPPKRDPKVTYQA